MFLGPPPHQCIVIITQCPRGAPLFLLFHGDRAVGEGQTGLAPLGAGVRGVCAAHLFQDVTENRT